MAEAPDESFRLTVAGNRAALKGLKFTLASAALGVLGIFSKAEAIFVLASVTLLIGLVFSLVGLANALRGQGRGGLVFFSLALFVLLAASLYLIFGAYVGAFRTSVGAG